MKPSNLIWTILKFAVAGGLIVWMVEEGKLDFKELKIVVEKPEILVFIILQWTFLTALACGTRWFLLLRGQNLPVEYARTLKLHLTGLFFNTVMPGAVGGDIIKGAYVIRDQKSRRTPAMMTVILDRVVGLMGLFMVGGVCILLNFQKFWESPALRPVLLLVMGMLAVTIAIYIIGLMPLAEDRDPILKLLNWRMLPGRTVFDKIYRSFRSYRHKPGALLGALAMSIVIQSLTMAFFIYLTIACTGQHVDIMDFASIYPVGMLVTALPLAPGGLGVGHAAFGELYKMIGLTDGANMFNIYFLGSMSLNLLGAIPYMFLTANTKQIKNAEKELEGEAYLDTTL